MTAKLTYHGHACFSLEGAGKTIFSPCFGPRIIPLSDRPVTQGTVPTSETALAADRCCVCAVRSHSNLPHPPSDDKERGDGVARLSLISGPIFVSTQRAVI